MDETERVKTQRYYCWFMGGDTMATDDGKCEECLQPVETHRRIPDDICGCFASCKDRNCPDKRDHGHPCQRAPRHPGGHEC